MRVLVVGLLVGDVGLEAGLLEHLHHFLNVTFDMSELILDVLTFDLGDLYVLLQVIALLF